MSEHQNTTVGSNLSHKIGMASLGVLSQAAARFKALIGPTETVFKTTFTILMANDVYDIAPDYNGLGGLAELSTLIKREMATLNSKNVMTTLNGDFLSASSLAVKYKGAHMIDIFNTMPLDYIVLGNHEFDFGAEVLRDRISESKNITYFASNILDTETGKVMAGCIEKKVLEVDGFKIGLFGVCTRATTSLSRPGPSVQFLPVVETSKKLVQELRDVEGCELVIALTHLGIDEDRELARLCPGIDVMIGGHDHTPHTQVQGTTFIHKAGHDGHYLTRIDLIIEKKRTRVKHQVFEKVKVFPACNMILNRGIEPDPIVKERVDFYLAQLPEDSKEEIGLFSTPIDSSTESVRGKEATMGNLVCDAIKHYYQTELVLIQGGTIRGDRPYDIGHRVTKGDFYREFPFPTALCAASISGDVFLEAIEQMISKAEFKPGCFPQLGKGISIEYDVKQPPMKRIVSATFNGEPIDPKRVYSITSTDYLLGGGDGVSALKKATVDDKHARHSHKLCDTVIEYVCEFNVVGAKKEGRIYVIQKRKPAGFSASSSNVKP